MRALVVDDSRAMRRILVGFLRELAFEVSEAEDGVAALERVSLEGAPDFALIDGEMPRMNGLVLVRALRARSDCRDVRIMMVTTDAAFAEVEAALAAGADEYVMKPFTRDVLLEKLGLIGLELV